MSIEVKQTLAPIVPAANGKAQGRGGKAGDGRGGASFGDALRLVKPARPAGAQAATADRALPAAKGQDAKPLDATRFAHLFARLDARLDDRPAAVPEAAVALPMDAADAAEPDGDVDAEAEADPGEDAEPALDAAPPSPDGAQEPAPPVAAMAIAVAAQPPAPSKTEARTPVEAPLAVAGDDAPPALAEDGPPMAEAAAEPASGKGAAGEATPQKAAAQVAAADAAAPRNEPAPAAASVRPEPAEPRPAEAARPAEAPKITARVTVVAEQTLPAPAAQTGVFLAERIAAEASPPSSVEKPTFQIFQSHAPAVSTQSLKIQLHPAELGMVTANLRFAGSQLSIEIEVDNAEAHRRLSADADAIVASLKSMGYEVDKVSVLQPAIAPAASARVDAGAAAALPGQSPDQASGQGGAGAAGAGSGGARGQQPGGQGNDGRQGSGQATARQSDGAGGGLYI